MRGDYFKTFRADRTVLKKLTLLKPCFSDNPCAHSIRGRVYKKTLKDEISALREIYYCIIPRLFMQLHWIPDRVLLLEVEYNYYIWLNTAIVISNRGGTAKRLSFNDITNNTDVSSV